MCATFFKGRQHYIQEEFKQDYIRESGKTGIGDGISIPHGSRWQEA